MEVKGSAVISLPLFIKENFGEEEFDRWLSLLSNEARCVYSGKIEPAAWYHLKPILTEPTRKLCEVFYNNNLMGAWACGMFSANYSLHGFLRFVVKLGTPAFIINRARYIFTTYYTPSEMEVKSLEKSRAVVRITSFPELDEVIEARICGWIEQALEIHGCKELKLDIEKSLTRKDPYSEFVITWK